MGNREFDRAVSGAASAIGAGIDIETAAGYMPQYDDRGMEDLYYNAVAELAPGEKNNGSFFHFGSTDMGELSTIMPTLHGYVQGMKGTAHGVDYVPENKELLYLLNTKIILSIIVDLLADDAKVAKDVAARRDGKLSIGEYIKLADSFNSKFSTDVAEL